MLKKSVLLLSLFCTTSTYAAATCGAGQYLNGDTCTPCPVGTYKDTTGPQECTPCPPADETTRRTTFPDEYYPYDPVTGTYVKTTELTFVDFKYEHWVTGLPNINMCVVVYYYSNVAGFFGVEGVFFNPATGKYDATDGIVRYNVGNPTYYLDTRFADNYCIDHPTALQYYKKAIVCPAGYYCPGVRVPSCATNAYESERGRTICPAGHYCPAGASAPTLCPVGTYRAATGGASVDDCTACPAGTSTHSGAATSVSDCRPLCTSGITKLHAGQYVFTIWKDKQTSPSINIQVSTGNVCYVNLVPGTGNLNFRVGDAVYHAVD